MGFSPALFDLLGEVKRLIDSSSSSRNQNHPGQKTPETQNCFTLEEEVTHKQQLLCLKSDVGNMLMVDEKPKQSAEQSDNGLERTIEHRIWDRRCVPHRDVLRGNSAVPLQVLNPYNSSTQIWKTRKIPVVMETVSCRRCPRCDRLLHSQWQVNWRNSHFLSCISSLFHTDTTSISSGDHPFSIFLGCTHQHVRPRLSLAKHVCKRTEVVYGTQTASSWGSGVPESFVNAVRD